VTWLLQMPRAVIDNMNNGGGAMRIDWLECACCRSYPDDATIRTLAIRTLSVAAADDDFFLLPPLMMIHAACAPTRDI
jgi:hypothetical protein